MRQLVPWAAGRISDLHSECISSDTFTQPEEVYKCNEAAIRACAGIKIGILILTCGSSGLRVMMLLIAADLNGTVMPRTLLVTKFDIFKPEEDLTSTPADGRLWQIQVGKVHLALWMLSCEHLLRYYKFIAGFTSVCGLGRWILWEAL